jgi:alkylation response protein AidB-like acyl-CoA dehydrogenase
MTYRAPVADISFTLNNGADFARALADGLYGDLSSDVVEAVLTEAGKFATDVLAPLNTVGDREGARFKDGAVTTQAGWKEAYHAWAQAGWNALAAPAQWGRPGTAACAQRRLPGNVELRRHGLRARPRF